MPQLALETARRISPIVDDIELVHRALAGEAHAFDSIMTRHNRRLYRLARSIVRDNGEAEDVLQEAYFHAFSGLADFRGESTLATWLTRIVVNEALGRLRKRRREAVTASEATAAGTTAQVFAFPNQQGQADPERAMAQRQILDFVERATDSLPDVYRTVFVARVIEGLSIEETAQCLGLRPETVKTRLHRARKLVREQLDQQIGPVLLDAFPFAGRRCERVTQTVMRRLGLRG